MLKSFLFVTKPLRYAVDRFFYKRTEQAQRLASLKDTFVGKPMLIIGNGPSLNVTPLDDFVNVPAIGMNKIDLLYERVKWRPSFVLATNNLVVGQHWQPMRDSGIPIYLSWKSRLFVPRKQRSNFMFFLNNTSSEFSSDVCNGIGGAGTVTYSALQFAYYCGADPVILFGVDHSFKTEGNPNDIQKKKSEDVNHFHPDYFAKGQYWGVPNLELSEVGFLNAKTAFEKAERRVFDATIGGKLQIFDKIDVKKAKELCGL